jgi:hypothetical protein
MDRLRVSSLLCVRPVIASLHVDLLGARVLLQQVCQTIRLWVTDRPRERRPSEQGSDCPQPSDHPWCRVEPSIFSGVATAGFVSFYEPSVQVRRTICQVQSDRPPAQVGPSVLVTADYLSHLLLELCFRFGLCWDFLGLVGSL